MEKKNKLGYHQRILPWIQKKQINAAIIAPAGSGKTTILFWLLRQIISKNNANAHIIFFSTTMDSYVNSEAFEKYKNEQHSNIYLLDKIPDKSVDEFRLWLHKLYANSNKTDMLETLNSDQVQTEKMIQPYYTPENKPNEPRAILVIDDCFEGKHETVEKMIQVGRHENVDVLVCAHSYINLTPSIRAWMDIFFIRNIAPRHLKDVYSSYIQSQMEEDEFKDLTKKIFNTPYLWFYFATQSANYGIFSIQSGFKSLNKKQ